MPFELANWGASLALLTLSIPYLGGTLQILQGCCGKLLLLVEFGLPLALCVVLLLLLAELGLPSPLRIESPSFGTVLMARPLCSDMAMVLALVGDTGSPTWLGDFSSEPNAPRAALLDK